MLVDGAHALGQIPLDVPSIGADYYVGNAHKWLYSPKGSAFLWVHPDAQEEVWPVVVSGGPGDTPFQQRFSWAGTADFSAYFALERAMEFRASLPGGDSGCMDYMTSLSNEGGRLLADAWETDTLTDDARDMQAAMVNVKVPLQPLPDPDVLTPGGMAQRLLARHNTYVPVFEVNGWWYVRVSAQIYNSLEDFEHLAQAVLQVVGEIQQ